MFSAVSDMEKISMRKARPEDKEGVLKMTEVYNGRDYLPAYYDHFLTSSDMFPAVMLQGDKIISFVVGHVIDNGETLISRAGRTHPQYRGKGLLIRLGTYIIENWVLSKGITSVLFTITDANPHFSNESFQRLNKFSLAKQVPFYEVTGEEIRFSKEAITDLVKLRTVSDMEMAEYFTSHPVREYLSKEGRMIVDGVPYRMIRANIKAMREPQAFTTIYSDIKQTNGVCSGLLSFGLVCAIRSPQYKYVIDIFGTDLSSLRTHIMRHLFRLKDKTKGVTVLLVFVPKEVDLEHLDAVFKEFGASRQSYKSKDPTLNTRQIYAYETWAPSNKSKL